MSQAQQTLIQFIQAQNGIIPNNDIAHMFTPLMEEVARLHQTEKVASLHPSKILVKQDGTLCLDDPKGLPIKTNHRAISKIQRVTNSALQIVGNLSVTSHGGYETQVEDLDIGNTNDSNDPDSNDSDQLEKPVYLVDYQAWESKLSHHDELSDIFRVGLLLASVSCGLDFSESEDLKTFTLNRTNLFRLNSTLHPAIATIIEGMTELNRHDRESDLLGLSKRLLHYRDEQGRFNSQRIIESIEELPQRRSAILSNLRDRLFDLSRRNKLIHFKPSQASVNMTVASVPIVMRIESIRKEQLCTWGNTFEKSMLSGKSYPLGKWLRFEDQAYLPSSINRLIQQSRRDKAEYGFTSLRLVVAFFNWVNLKDAPEDKISSPLLWLSVDLKKKKGVRDQYLINSVEPVAEFNPALRHYLKQLYDINLPESIDLNEYSIHDVHKDIARQIAQSEPDVKLTLSEQPSIRLIHEKAVKRLHAFNKRRGKRNLQNTVLANYNYSEDDYRPLGKAIFDKYIVSEALPQGSALGQVSQHRPDYMSTPSNEASAQTYVLDKANTGKYNWEIDLAQVTLANFNYKKMSLVRDYSDLIDNSNVQSSLDKLFSIHPRQEESARPKPIPIAEQFNVVPSDSTQDQAVAFARQGESFIIQGPPGTGKSQTITNLIADYASRNKRILFVCEKRAALDVVFNRLKQAGLEKLACIIHDIQEDKKPFIHDLKAVYEDWFESASKLDEITAKRESILQALEHSFSQINLLDSLLANVDQKHAQSVQSLVRLYMDSAPISQDYAMSVRQQLPTYQQWQEVISLAKRIELSLSEQLGYSSLASSPFAQLSAELLSENDNTNSDNSSQENIYIRVQTRIELADELLDELQAAFDHTENILGEHYFIDELIQLSQFALRSVNTGLIGNLSLFDPASALTIKVKQDLLALQQQQERIKLAEESAGLWKEPLTPQDTQTALSIAKDKEKSFFSFLSSDWRSLKKTLHRVYDFTKHAVKPSYTSVIEQLDTLYKEQQIGETLKQELSTYLDCESAEALLELQTEIEHASVQHDDIRSLFTVGNEAILRVLASSFKDIAQLDNLLASIFFEYESYKTSTNCAHLQTQIRDMRESLDELPIVLPLLQACIASGKETSFMLRNIDGSVNELQALVVDEALQQCLRERPELANFDIAKLTDLSKRSAKAKELLLSENAQMIVAQRHELFAQHVRHSNLSVTQMNEQERAFKKQYNAGRREVEHEFSKTMRYKSIRDMASENSGAVVADLKPIWLMSPLSVSDTLPLDPALFDVVIFDEASQIPIEDGIPALCRAPQLIVVGDEMQLPPTSFFSASVNEEDMEIEVQEDGEVMNVLLDADSLLAQAARHLPATLLAWHYRSRSESLISFSNAAFYDSQLVTIPDQKPLAESPLIDEISLEENSAKINTIIQKPISFHFIPEGIYEKRCNIAEAQEIALMVQALLVSKQGDSIGIVAFSEAQQNCIEEALEKLAEDNAVFAALLEEEYQREDDEQFTGLFIKNLENVQGDERDIIILSICYAKGPTGKMLMNFGPINQRGGEKRLNVIFSRARKHMAVVSSISAEAITNTHNDGAFALRTFLAFAKAQSDNNAQIARQALSKINPKALEVFSAKPPHDSMRSAIAERLRENGHLVDEYVGSASFRCDLAVIDPKCGSYCLGILLDKDVSHETENEVFERYVFKPNILRAFSWRVIDVFSSAWVKSPDNVIAQIEDAINNQSAHVQISEQDLFSNIAINTYTANNAQHLQAPTNEPPTATEVVEPAGDEFKYLQYSQGKSNKFWAIAQQGNELVIKYGRVGSKGHTISKSFDSEERASSQRNKLIQEKIRKGYEEKS